MKNIFLCMLGLAVASSVLAAGSDELWEVSSKMEMKGMPFAMPAHSSNVCIPKGQEKDPNRSVPNDKNCKMSDVKPNGNKMTWNMRCEGKDAMSGNGEMTYGTGTYSGKMNMHSKDGDMIMAYDGKRIGTCDAAAEKKKLDDKMGAMLNDVCTAQVEATVNSGGLEAKMPAIFSNKDQCASSKPEVCEKTRSFIKGYDGYRIYAKSKGWVVKECGINLEANRAALCQTAMTDKKGVFFVENCPAEVKVLCKQSLSDRKFGVVAKYCPAEAKVLSEKNCQAWGRDYTSDHDNEYSPICAKYSKNKRSYEETDDAVADEASTDSASDKGGLMGKLFGGGSKDSTAAKKEEKSTGSTDNPAGAVLDGAKKLKGLFGF